MQQQPVITSTSSIATALDDGDQVGLAPCGMHTIPWMCVRACISRLQAPSSHGLISSSTCKLLLPRGIHACAQYAALPGSLKPCACIPFMLIGPASSTAARGTCTCRPCMALDAVGCPVGPLARGTAVGCSSACATPLDLSLACAAVPAYGGPPPPPRCHATAATGLVASTVATAAAVAAVFAPPRPRLRQLVVLYIWAITERTCARTRCMQRKAVDCAAATVAVAAAYCFPAVTRAHGATHKHLPENVVYARSSLH